MRKKYGWLMVLVAVVLLMVACGPQMATPTAGVKSGDKEPTPTQVARQTGAVSTAPAGETASAGTAAVQPPDYSQLPVDANDWRTLGSPDAPVTIVEYSDFQ
jgi:protein-disulfide isomerase